MYLIQDSKIIGGGNIKVDKIEAIQDLENTRRAIIDCFKKQGITEEQFNNMFEEVVKSFSEDLIGGG